MPKTKEGVPKTKNTSEKSLPESDFAQIHKTSKEPQTMEELLTMTGYQIKGLRKRERVEGVVTEITPNSISIDIGGKTRGVVLGKELDLVKNFVTNLKVGDRVNAVVGSPETDRGQILLNLREAAKDYTWKKYEDLLLSEEEVEVKGREINKGGLIVDTPNGLQGFIPGSQIGSDWRGKIDQLIGRDLKARVIEVKKDQNRLVFSEKSVSDSQKIAQLAKLVTRIKVGEQMKGEISQIVPFGLFVKVKIDGESIEGLAHISEVSWLKVEDLSKIYKVGDEVKVKVISTGDNRLQFSIKQLLPDPWEGLEKKYPLEKHFSGRVVKLASFGALVEIEPGIEGLLHISKIPPEFSIKEGNEVDIYIDSVDRKGRRISLGLVLKEKPVEYK